MIESLLSNSRFLAIIIVVVALISSLLLYGITTIAAINETIAIVGARDLTIGAAKLFAVKLLQIVDLLLICIGLQTIGAGVYKLFINEQLTLPAAMDISSFADLKNSISRIISLLLVIMFLGMVVEGAAGMEVLQYGVAIAALLFVVNRREDGAQL